MSTRKAISTSLRTKLENGDCRHTLKRLLVRLSRWMPLRALPLESMMSLSQRVSTVLARALVFRDWHSEANGRPQFFKHQVNLSRWANDPSQWAFTARGVYARAHMFKNCKVLDLCCGDGSYSYLFFSDIAGNIDAVDNDPHAIRYARLRHSAPNISFHQLDIVREALPARDYDVVVWNAAICYFSEEAIGNILRQIVNVGGSHVVLCGMLPRANGWIDHKTEYQDAASVEKLLAQYFESVKVIEIDEVTAVTFYFEASEPLQSLADGFTPSSTQTVGPGRIA
jgi:SAM-dependent methyltransferase